MLTIKCSRKGDDIIEIFEIRFKYFIEGNIIARFLWNERNAFSFLPLKGTRFTWHNIANVSRRADHLEKWYTLFWLIIPVSKKRGNRAHVYNYTCHK